MEYIDGEDLSTLLRRIGHLPLAKGIGLARQLCMGLAAAHDAGMVHRDLKPANIMLDGRGRARITDFGLSGLAGEFRGLEIAGTPAYMAPEQLKGAPATHASDIYALGLVLYEVFTGTRAFEGRTVRDLIDRHAQTPQPPSSRIRDMDPLLEETILRCLEEQPRDRPRTPFEVAAALPGGDPLAAALAAGETPSPEMVAAAGEKAGLPPSLAWPCLIGVLAVLLAVGWLFNPAHVRSSVLETSPEALAHTARRLIGKLGYPASPADAAYGFVLDQDFLTWGQERPDNTPFKSYLARERPGWIRFWYRESPQPLLPATLHEIGPIYASPGSRITWDDPPPRAPEMRGVVLDSHGRLLEFDAIPAEGAEPRVLLGPLSDRSRPGPRGAHTGASGAAVHHGFRQSDGVDGNVARANRSSSARRSRILARMARVLPGSWALVLRRTSSEQHADWPGNPERAECHRRYRCHGHRRPAGVAQHPRRPGGSPRSFPPGAVRVLYHDDRMAVRVGSSARSARAQPLSQCDRGISVLERDLGNPVPRRRALCQAALAADADFVEPRPGGAFQGSSGGTRRADRHHVCGGPLDCENHSVADGVEFAAAARTGCIERDALELPGGVLPARYLFRLRENAAGAVLFVLLFPSRLAQQDDRSGSLG